MLTIRAHARKTLRFALPVMVARAGLLVLVTVDTAMTGHAGAKSSPTTVWPWPLRCRCCLSVSGF